MTYSPSRTGGLSLQPPLILPSPRAPPRETVLCRDHTYVVCRLVQDCIVSDKRKQYGAAGRADCQRRRMSERAGLGDCCFGAGQPLFGKSKAKKYDTQLSLRHHLWVNARLIDQRAVRYRIINRAALFEVEPGCGKLACHKQRSAQRVITQNEPPSILALTAKP